MTHAEAVAIIRAPRRDGPESYLLYSAACAKVYVDHMQQTRPGTFTRDVGEPSPNWRTARSNPDAPASSARSDMGRDPESRSGARLVQILDGPVTSYFVASDGQGRACLYQSSDVDDAIDSHRTATGSRVAATADRTQLMKDAQTRAGLEQFRNASIALRTRAFWEDAPTRDAAPQPQGRIGAQAEAFWRKQQTGAA